MRPEWQNRFVDRRTAGTLVFQGETCGGAWHTGVLRSTAADPVATVSNGIVDFIGHPTWPEDELNVPGGWAGFDRQLAANWNNGIPGEWFTATTRELLSADPGLIVELAAGPGGGNLPWLLRENPRARVLVNDIERRVVEGWQRFLASGAGPNTSYAVFDGLQPPLRDGAVDWAMTAAGFSEMSVGSDDLSTASDRREQAVREVFRVLRPGGRLVALEGVVALSKGQELPVPAVPTPFGQTLLGQRPWDRTLARAGFAVDRCELVFSRMLEAAESALQAVAERYDMQLEMRLFAIEARRPA